MRATVVCESAFGNTRKIAEAIAEALDAELLSVEDSLPDLDALDLLVVGAPTHVHGLPSERSRKAAVDQGGTGVDPTRGIRDWLTELPRANGQLVAAFDTRFEKPAWAHRIGRERHREAAPAAGVRSRRRAGELLRPRG